MDGVQKLKRRCLRPIKRSTAAGVRSRATIRPLPVNHSKLGVCELEAEPELAKDRDRITAVSIVDGEMTIPVAHLPLLEVRKQDLVQERVQRIRLHCANGRTFVLFVRVSHQDSHG